MRLTRLAGRDLKAARITGHIVLDSKTGNEERPKVGHQDTRSEGVVQVTLMGGKSRELALPVAGVGLGTRILERLLVPRTVPWRGEANVTFVYFLIPFGLLQTQKYSQ